MNSDAAAKSELETTCEKFDSEFGELRTPDGLADSCVWSTWINGQSQTRRRGCHCWELQDEPFALLFADELVLHAWISSQKGLQYAFDRFYATCDKAGTRISTKKIAVLCLLRRPRQCILQVSWNTLQQVETFKYFRVVLASDRSRNKEIDTRIGKANAVLRELYCSVVAKWELSKTAKLSVFKSVFVPILTCGRES